MERLAQPLVDSRLKLPRGLLARDRTAVVGRKIRQDGAGGADGRRAVRKIHGYDLEVREHGGEWFARDQDRRCDPHGGLERGANRQAALPIPVPQGDVLHPVQVACEGSWIAGLSRSRYESHVEAELFEAGRDPEAIAGEIVGLEARPVAVVAQS